MHTRSLLLSTVLVLGLGSVPAFAAESWSVTRIAAKGKDAEPYCAMARSFDSGVMLTIARNASGENTVALDFEKPFSGDAGAAQDVVLKTGSGQERTFNVKPISDRGIVVRLGKDEGFMNALEQSGQLAASVADRKLVFTEKNMKSNFQDLDACVGSSVEPAAGTADKAAMDDAPSMPAVKATPVQVEADAADILSAPEKPVMRDLTEEPTSSNKRAQAIEKNFVSNEAIQKKTRDAGDRVEMAASDNAPPVTLSPAPVPSAAGNDLESLQEENVRLRNALERERREFENRFQQQGQGSPAISELNEKLRLAEMENASLKEQVQQSGKPASKTCKTSEEDSAAMSAMSQEVETLRGENEKLKSDLAGAQTANKSAPLTPDADQSAELTQLKALLKSTEAENVALRQQLKSAPSSAPTASSMGDAETAALKSNVATVTQLRTTEAKLADVTAERDRLSAQLNNLQQTDADGRVKLSSDNWNLEQATRRFNEAEREVRRLGAQLDEERARCSRDKKELEYMLFDPKIAEKEQIARLLKLEEDLSAAKQEIEKGTKGKDDEIAGLKKELDAEKSRVERELQQRTADLEKSYGQKNDAALNDLKAQIAAAQTDKDAAIGAAKADADRRIAELQQKMTATENASTLAASTAVRASEQKIADLQARIATLEQEKATGAAALQSRVDTLTKEKAAAVAAAQTGADQRVATLQRELDAERAKAQQTIESRVAEMQRTLDSERAAVAQQKQGLDAQLSALQQQLAAKDTDMARISAQLATADAQMKIAQSNAAATQTQLVQAETEVAKASAQREIVDALKTEIASLNSQLANVQSEKSAMAMQLAQINTAAGSARATPPVQVAYGDYESAAPQPRPAAVAYQPPVTATVPAQAQSNFISVGGMERVLRQSGMSLSQGVKSIPSASGPGQVSYRWEAGKGIFGSAEQRAMRSDSEFDANVREYLSRTEQRCKGQFAAVPATDDRVNGGRIASYEIACIDATGTGASASLIFTGRDGVFSAIAHESAPESMDMAMDARDRLMGGLRSTGGLGTN